MMDTANFELVYDRFQRFHGFFASSFGCKQWREHSRNYLKRVCDNRLSPTHHPREGGSDRRMRRFWAMSCHTNQPTVKAMATVTVGAMRARVVVMVGRVCFPFLASLGMSSTVSAFLETSFR